MRLLLDTHIFQWLALSPELLLPGEQELLAHKSAHRLVSSVTIWELRIKWNSFHPSGDRKGWFDPVDAVEFARRDGIELAALAPEDCAARLDDTLPHGDPFDEMLLVHAQRLGAKLLTRDRILVRHPLAARISA